MGSKMEYFGPKLPHFTPFITGIQWASHGPRAQNSPFYAIYNGDPKEPGPDLGHFTLFITGIQWASHGPRTRSRPFYAIYNGDPKEPGPDLGHFVDTFDQPRLLIERVHNLTTEGMALDGRRVLRPKNGGFSIKTERF